MTELNEPLNAPGLSDNMAGGIAYVTIIPAIVFLILAPYKNSVYVRFHAWQSIFFFAAWAALNIVVSAVEHMIPPAVFLTLTAMELVYILVSIVWLIVVVSAFQGKRIVLPLIGHLAEAQAKR